MLRLEIESTEGFDESQGKFVVSPAAVLELEHSLVSVSKWEGKYKISFFDAKPKTVEQTRDYIRMMNLSGEFPDSVFDGFTAEDYDKIRAHVDEKMTATYVPELKSEPSKDIVTAELIYYWMISLEIPFECQYWPLDKLLTLIKLVNHKNAPKDTKRKNVTQDVLAQRRAINEQRKRELGSTG